MIMPLEPTLAERVNAPVVVIAEGDGKLRSLIVWALAHEGYRVIGAVDGLDVLDHVQREKIDAIVANARLPLISGVELIRAVRKKEPQLPIFLITDSASMSDNRARFMGATGLFRKPFNIRLIGDMLRKTIGSQPREWHDSPSSGVSTTLSRIHHDE